MGDDPGRYSGVANRCVYVEEGLRESVDVFCRTSSILPISMMSANNFTDFKKIFLDPANTKETIWSMHWDYTRDGGNGISKIGSGGNTSQYYIDSSVFLRFESNKNDIRRWATYDTTVSLTATPRIIQIGKFYPVNSTNKPVPPANAQNDAKLTLYRMADILLLRAEALNMTSAVKTPVFTIVNRIRTLRGATPLVATDYPTDPRC